MIFGMVIELERLVRPSGAEKDLDLTQFREFSPATHRKLKWEKGLWISRVQGRPLIDFGQAVNSDPAFSCEIHVDVGLDGVKKGTNIGDLPRQLRSNVVKNLKLEPEFDAPNSIKKQYWNLPQHVLDGVVKILKKDQELFVNSSKTSGSQISFDPHNLFFPQSFFERMSELTKKRKIYGQVQDETKKFEQQGIADAEFFIPDVNQLVEFMLSHPRELAVASRKLKISGGFLPAVLTTSRVFDIEHLAVVSASLSGGVFVGRVNDHDQVNIEDPLMPSVRVLRLIRPKTAPQAA